MQPSQERWLPAVGYEGRYEVSDQGRVRSLGRMVYAGRRAHRRRVTPRVLKAFPGGEYPTVRLRRNSDDRTTTQCVHALVMAAFVGPVPNGMEVCHNNGQHHDNRLANLRYDTRSSNLRDQVAHGVHSWSKRTHCYEGHEYTPENTYVRSNGGRLCRECKRARQRKSRRLASQARLARSAAA
jgi:hypothetical protein